MKKSIEKKIFDRSSGISYQTWLTLLDDLILINKLIDDVEMRNYKASQTVTDLNKNLAIALTKAELPEPSNNSVKSNSGKSTAYLDKRISSVGYYSPPKVIETNTSLLNVFLNRQENLESRLFDKAEEKDWKMRIEILYKKGLKNQGPKLESSIATEVATESLRELNKSIK